MDQQIIGRIKMIGKILKVEFVKNSTNGNAQYKAVVQTASGWIDTIYGRVDSSFNISMRNLEGKKVQFDYKISRNKMYFTQLCEYFGD